jgi:predicted Fe-S protein YdhL (DUF1289 family)
MNRGSRIAMCRYFRTEAEIRQWRKFTDHKRHQILAERRRREAKLVARKTSL